MACGHPVAGQVQQQPSERLRVTGKGRSSDDGESAGLSAPSDRAEQAGLADARFSRDEQQLAHARCCLGKPLLAQGQEFIPADQDR
jgi:hypothetical protein